MKRSTSSGVIPGGDWPLRAEPMKPDGSSGLPPAVGGRMVAPVISYVLRSARSGAPRPTLLKPGSAARWARAGELKKGEPNKDAAARTATLHAPFFMSLPPAPCAPPFGLPMPGRTWPGMARWSYYLREGSRHSAAQYLTALRGSVLRRRLGSDGFQIDLS